MKNGQWRERELLHVNIFPFFVFLESSSGGKGQMESKNLKLSLDPHTGLDSMTLGS